MPDRRLGPVVALAAVLVGLLLTTAAAAAPTARAPWHELLQAQNQIQTFARETSTKSAKASSSSAARKLGQATAFSLWVTANEIVAPTYGTNVFTDTEAALRDLQGFRSLSSAGRLIVRADRAIAANELALAGGGNAGVLAAARQQLATGDHRAAAGKRLSAAHSYEAAWQDAFSAIAQLVVHEVTSVPQSALADAAENALGSKQIGLAGPVITQGQPPLIAAGKPEVFFAGSEACPFCGVQRWGMIVALAQFGTFSNLHILNSTATEAPTVSTFTFFGSSYQSPYIAFVPVEAFSNVPGPLGFERLQSLTPAQQALVETYDPPTDVPFIDVDNRFVSFESTVLPQLIGTRSWLQIGGLLTNPASVPAQAVAGEAEVLTAEICESTGGNPSSICSQQVVKDYEAALPLLNGQGGGCPAAMDTVVRRTAMDTAVRRRANGPVATAAHCHR